MQRKLAPLIPCPELRYINKTMIIEVPPEFRECGHPVFRIVSSLEDIKNPKVKFKANDVLKAILEKGTAGRKLDNIFVEEKKGGLLKAAQYSSKGLEAHKESQKTSSVSVEHLSVLKNLQNTDSECETLPQLPKLAYLTAQEQDILYHEEVKTSAKFCSDNWVPFKDSEDFKSSQALNGGINHDSSREMIDKSHFLSTFNNHGFSSQVTPGSNPATIQKKEGFACGTPQNRILWSPQDIDQNKDHKFFLQKKKKNEPKSPQHRNPFFRKDAKKNCNSDQVQLSEYCNSRSSSEEKSVMPSNPFLQHSDFSSFHQHPGNNCKSFSSADQNNVKSFLQHQVSGLKTDEQKLSCGDISGAGSDTVFSNETFSWTKHISSNQEGSDPNPNGPGYTSRTNNKRKHQVANEMFKSANEFPDHCFQKDLKWGEIKQIVFLDVMSYPNFFREFLKIPPLGMHIWIFMPSDYKLKYPNELCNHRLLNMKLLHIALGDVTVKFPDVAFELHCRLSSNVQFIIISNKQFNIVGSIQETRSVKLVYPKFSKGMHEIYRYIFKVDD